MAPPDTIVYGNATGIGAVTLTLKGEGSSISYFDGEEVNWTVPRNISRSLRIKVPHGLHVFILVNDFGEENIMLFLDSGEDYEIASDQGKKLTVTRMALRQLSEQENTDSGSTFELSTPESTGTGSTGLTYVRGYYRKDGTYVRGCYRRNRRR
jgi:hypothetical protein